MTNFSNDDYERVGKALDASNELLFAAIGHHVIQLENANLGMATENESDVTQEEQEKRGRQWFEDHFNELRSNICLNKRLLEEVSKIGKNDKQMFGLLIADAISGAIIGIPPFFISALIVKIGLTELCNQTSANE